MITEKDFDKACKELSDLFINVEPYGQFNEKFFADQFVLYKQNLELFPDYKALKLMMHHDFTKMLPYIQKS